MRREARRQNAVQKTQSQLGDQRAAIKRGLQRVDGSTRNPAQEVMSGALLDYCCNTKLIGSR